MNILRLYRNLPDGPALALTIVLDADDRVSFVRGERYADEAMALVGEGAASVFDFRRIRPSEGKDYIRAVYDMLDRSSMWSVKVEVSPGATGPATDEPAP